HITGEKYLYDQGYNDVFFQYGYQNHLKEVSHIIALIKDDPDQTNTYAMARVLRVYAFEQITDFYGDIPYSEANKGYLEALFKPKYDKQSDIYADMLKELDEAAQMLDPAKPNIGPADFIYNGDAAKWKRFAYSMMLRLGMRLTKVDPAMSENYVKKAIAGGVMQSNSDIALLNHTNGTSLNWNWDSYYQNMEELRPNAMGYGLSKLCVTFVDFLKNNDDPRLPFYATLWEGNVDPSQLPASSAPAVQKGLPNGYDNTTIHTAVPGWTDASYLEYSEINLNTIANMAAPSIFQSYAEVELLLSEAAIRGWGDGNAQLHYNNALTASMEMVTLFPGGFTISPTAISDYLAA
ncbi:MAG: SusD/RagB family nutrient-binding outer membrane lipoprotein, partial [Ginsengibacter sp.]